MPNFTVQIAVMGLTKLSECDNIELTAVLLQSILFPVEYSWNISFSENSPYMSQAQIDTANEYFQQFSDWAIEVGVTLPSALFAKDCELSVTLYSRLINSTGTPISVTETITILADIPKAKFTNKATGVQELSGDMPTDIPILIGNKQCTKTANTTNSSRLMQTINTNAVNLTFQLFSATDAISMPTIRGKAEMAIESKLNDMYSQNQLMSLNISLGFKYKINYQILMTVLKLSTGEINSDTMIFYFDKPSVNAVIDNVGNLVSLKKDLILNGANTIVPESNGDLITYTWKCKTAKSYVSGGSCVCPILSDTQLSSPTMLVPKTKMVAYCYYTFLLTVSALSPDKTKRVGTDSVDFLAFPGTVSPANGLITQGTNETMNDMYFSFTLTDSPVPDSQLTYNWTLVEIIGTDVNTTTNYSETNTYMFNFLASMNIVGNAAKKLKDRPIPDSIKPKYITPTLTRVLGVDGTTLISKAQYTFGVQINYPDGPSFAFVYFKVNQLPRSRVFTIFPLNGTGMSTQFSLMFSLLKSTGKDTANYQIYRRDCPGSGNPAAPVTQVIPTSSCYTTTLSAGQQSCNYQVEVILRALEFGDWKEVSTVITIVNSNATSTSLLSTQLGGLQANQKFLTPNQVISALNELTNVPNTEASTSGQTSVNTTLSLLSNIDSPGSGTRTLMDNSKLPGLLNTTANTMGKMLVKQTANVDPDVAGNMTNKMSSYLNDSSKVEGGSSIISSCVGTLSGVAGVGNSTDSNSSFYDGIQNTLAQTHDMKLKEVQPGAPSYSVTTSSIEVVAQSNYASSFDSPQTTASGKGNEMNLPGGLGNTVLGTIANNSGKTNNTPTLATSMNTVAYNPYTNIKSSSSLNASDLANSSTSGVSPSQIVNMYSDLSKGNVDGVNKNDQEQNILQISFKPFQVQKNGSSVNTSSSFDMQLPPGKNVEMGFPSGNNVSNSTKATFSAQNDLAIPMYYNAVTKTWVNQGCKLINSTSLNKLVASCDSVSPPSQKILKI